MLYATTIDKIFETALVFMWNIILQENFNFYSSAVFASIDKILLGEEDWALGYNSMNFWDFPDLS